MSRLKIAVVGIGQQGTHHCTTLMSHPEMYELVATCDITPARRVKAESRFPVPCYHDLTALLADESVEWVVIATPSSLHADDAIRSLEAGKHVVVEKPMCMTAAEADAMAAAAEKANRHLVVFQNRRWDHDYLSAKAAYESGCLGEVFTVKHEGMGYGSGLVDFGVKEFRPTWRAEKEWGGGLLYDWGAHRLDQLLFMVKSDPKRVFASLERRIWSTEVDTQFTIFIEFENGCKATMESSFICRAGHWGFIVCGTEGAYQNGKMTVAGKGEEPFEAPHPTTGFWHGLYDGVTKGGPMPVPLDESRKLMRVVDAIFESDATHKVVEL